jgi:ADP-ribose pyrophosphatase
MKPDQTPFSDFTETTRTSKGVYQGKLLTVHEDVVVLPDGREALREYIVHPGAVIIIAQLDNDEVVLERQFRYALRRHMIELPAGKIDPGETPLFTAQRELLEETGYEAAGWEHMGTVHPCVGYADERIELYRARGLTLRQQQLEEGEFLDVFTLPLAEALRWVENGQITDVKTVAGLFWLERLSRS